MRLPALAALALFACNPDLTLSSNTSRVTCAEGQCPSSLVCVSSGCHRLDDPCIQHLGEDWTPAPDGNPCVLDNGLPGICLRATCLASRCGDGWTDPATEECDDGNTDDHDACLTSCKRNVCGDGILNPATEQCDDGNRVDEDGCLSTCKLNVCGDGVRNPLAEECDDGNSNDEDACLITCKRNVCGDGFRNPAAEQCDEGKYNGDANACTSKCVPARCGDGLVFAGIEQCDDGSACDSGGPCAVAADCPSGESCAPRSGDGCRADCLKIERAGDGVLDQGECCDDGPNPLVVANPNDGCNGARCNGWSANLETGLGPSGGLPTSLKLSWPEAIAADRLGRIYLADTLNYRVLRIDPRWSGPGSIAVVAGTGQRGFAGDGGLATAAKLDTPTGLAVDGSGNLYIADRYNHRIRRVCLDGNRCAVGTIQSVAGSGPFGEGAGGYSGDNGLATLARLNEPTGLALEPDGSLLIADYANHVIRRICAGDAGCAAGTVSTIAGVGPTHCSLNAAVCGPQLACAPAVGTCTSGGNSGDGGLATAAALNLPRDVAVDANGRIFIADLGNNVVRMIEAGVISRLAGNPAAPSLDVAQDSGAPSLSVHLWNPSGVRADDYGNVYVADGENHRLRRICVDGVGCTKGTTTTVAGACTIPSGGACNYGGAAAEEGVPATTAHLQFPKGVAVTFDGDLLVADAGNNRVRRVCLSGNGCTAGNIETLAGSTIPLIPDRPFSSVSAVSPNGSTYLVNLFAQTIVAGSVRIAGVPYTSGFSGDGGPASAAKLYNPSSLAFDAAGDLFVADQSNHRIRRICLSGSGCTQGNIDTVAGMGPTHCDNGKACTANADCVGIGSGNCWRGGFAGDGGRAIDAALNYPNAVAALASGDLMVVDSGNFRVRRVCLSGSGCAAGTIDTVLGTGQLYCMDYTTPCTKDSDCAVGSCNQGGYSGDGGPGTKAELAGPLDIRIDADGNPVVLDQLINQGLPRFIQRKLCVQAAGCPFGPAGTVISIPANDPAEEGPLASAALSSPGGIAWLPSSPGTLLVADGASGRIRRLQAGSALDTVVGYPRGFADGADPLHHARFSRLLRDPFGIAVETVGATDHIYVSERDGHTLREIVVVDPANPYSWTISTLGGALGQPGYADGPVSTARFNRPAGLALDQANHILYVADSGNHAIRRITLANGTVDTVGGIPGMPGFFGEFFAATRSLFHGPEAVAVGRGGLMLYVADSQNHRVRAIDLAQSPAQVQTVIGDGQPASSGDGAPASLYPVDTPWGLALDPFGNLYVSSRLAVRRIAAGLDGIALGDDDVATVYGKSPRSAPPDNSTWCITGLAADPADPAKLWLADACQGWLVSFSRYDQ